MASVSPGRKVYVFSANSGVVGRIDVWVSGLSCIERYGKVKMPCVTSKIALFRRRKHNPISGFGRFFIIMKFSFNMKSATSNSRSTVPIGTSNCPFATMIWKFGGGPVSLIASFASNLILLRSCSEIALVRAPVSIRPSSVSFSKSIGM